ncbi:MAG: hypothetical protein WCD07_01100 [Burkholderiales bacterium]
MLSTSGDPIHIIEPTLRDEAGHCHSLIASLAACNHRPSLVVWTDKQIQLSLLALLPALKVQPYFSRRLRRIQSFFLFRHLLKQSGKIFVSTAGRADLQLMDWAAGNRKFRNKIFFYVHWLDLSAEKIYRLKKIAQRHPEFNLFATTGSAAASLRACGFISVKQISYPVAASATAAHDSDFRHVLLAGAARQDKGIIQVIDYIEYLYKSGLRIPIAVQTSAEHYGKMDAATRAIISRLDAIDYAPLIRQRQTLSTTDYRAMFAGAICLQPYDPADFADRVSGVTLDALRAGAPLITTDHTWMANVVKRFEAGLVLPDRSAPSIHQAVEKIRARYRDYQKNARRAGQVLESENSAQHLMDAITAVN